MKCYSICEVQVYLQGIVKSVIHTQQPTYHPADENEFLIMIDACWWAANNYKKNKNKRSKKINKIDNITMISDNDITNQKIKIK